MDEGKRREEKNAFFNDVATMVMSRLSANTKINTIGSLWGYKRKRDKQGSIKRSSAYSGLSHFATDNPECFVNMKQKTMR